MTVTDSPRRLVWDAQKVIAVSAALVTIVLTVVAFWLSYEHLHDLAGHHQLQGGRAWAWPATVDLFIAAGELLVLRASLTGRTDRFAVALTIVGSGGSIALNIAAAGSKAQPLDYVVAAVPPVAALLAFGALMLQLHDHLTAPAEPEPGTTPVSEPVLTPLTVNASKAAPPPWKPATPKRTPALQPPPAKAVSAAVQPRQPVVTVPVSPAAQSPQGSPTDAIVRRLYDDLGQKRPGTRHIVDALRQNGLPHSEGTAREARKRVETAEPALKLLPPA